LVGTAQGFDGFPYADPRLFRDLPAPKGRKFLQSWSSCESRASYFPAQKPDYHSAGAESSGESN
jgi:hypothetical protein